MNEPNEAARDELAKIVETCVGKLSEHFDQVQIFCNNIEQGGDTTSTFTRGSGNFLARMRQVEEWIIYHDEQMRTKARRDFEEDND